MQYFPGNFTLPLLPFKSILFSFYWSRSKNTAPTAIVPTRIRPNRASPRVRQNDEDTAQEREKDRKKKREVDGQSRVNIISSLRKSVPSCMFGIGRKWWHLLAKLATAAAAGVDVDFDLRRRESFYVCLRFSHYTYCIPFSFLKYIWSGWHTFTNYLTGMSVCTFKWLQQLKKKHTLQQKHVFRSI